MDYINEIKQKANWCLGCKNKPCSKACPMNTNIPEFIKKIKEDKFEEAYNILIDNNLLSHICSFICPQEEQCEGACVRRIKYSSTHIGELEKFVNEWAIENNIRPSIKKEKLINDTKVAIIGAGPAGLSCSYELAKKGIKCVIYEKENTIGGVLNYGIPDFRLNKNLLEKILDILKDLGVDFRFGQELGKSFSIKSLKKEYNYIFIGIGAEVSSMYKLTDEKIDSIFDSDTFLRAYNYKKFISNLGNVIVIGGGNVAMDCARSAVKMGAKKVSILYRRDIEHMPARKKELEDAIKDGVEFIELTRVDKANIVDGKIISVHCNKTRIVDGKAEDIKGEEFDYDANIVVFAIGLKPNKELLQKEGFELTEYGTIKVDDNFLTSIEDVYSGGDVTENKSVVCKAVANGKKAANSIYEKYKK